MSSAGTTGGSGSPAGAPGDAATAQPRGNGEGIVVRAARAGDAPALAALSTELGYAADATQIAGRLSGLLVSADDVVFVAVADETQIVGFVHAAEKRLLVSAPFVELEGLIVAAAARRQGAAGLLIEAVEWWSLARSVGELRVRARLERDVADLFYRRRGFELEKEQRVFAKRLAPAKTPGTGATGV